MRAMTLIAGFLATLTALAGTGCNETNELRGFCTSDEECPAGIRCDRDTGICVCANDDV